MPTKISPKRNKAKFLLKKLFREAGFKLNGDQLFDIETFVDQVIDAAKQELLNEYDLSNPKAMADLDDPSKNKNWDW